MSFVSILDELQGSERRRLDSKMPSWAGAGITVPAAVNLQQCSGEEAARYKASLLPCGARVADLTGGLGADSWAFSRRAAAVWYNERDAVLLEAVKCNFALLDVHNVEFHGFDIGPETSGWKESLCAFAPDLIYLDPARRSADGKKVFLLEDCSPDVLQIMPALLDIAPRVMIKVSPMADITMLRRRLDGSLHELIVSGASGECKELLCLCRRDAGFQGVRLHENGADFDSSRSYAPGTLLFVPSASLVKSGLGPGMGLMEYDDALAPFGRFWRVTENLPFASSVIKDLGRRYPKAEVTARGVPLSSDGLRAKMKTKPGGSVHIFACSLNGERRILVCEL